MGTRDPDSGEKLPEGMSSPFPDPGETSQDYDTQAQSRIATQYRESPRLKATVSALVAPMQALEDCASVIPGLDDPNAAPYASPDVNLDVTGELVGQSRVLSSGTSVNDTLFRTYIAARILRNKTIGPSPDFITALEMVFGATPFRYYDLGGMAVGIELGTGSAPSADQIALLDDGPMTRAMAVGVGRAWYDPASVFGFSADAGALGFGEAGDPSKGGHFAEAF